MKLNINLKDDDFIAFNIYYIFNSPSGKRSISMGRSAILIIAIIATAIFLFVKADSKLILGEAIVLLVIGFIWFFFYPGFVKKNISKRIRKMRRDGNLPYETEVEINFMDDLVTEKTEASSRETPYSDFTGIKETDEYIYIEKHNKETMIIPLRCIDDKNALLAYLREKI